MLTEQKGACVDIAETPAHKSHQHSMCVNKAEFVGDEPASSPASVSASVSPHNLACLF